MNENMNNVNDLPLTSSITSNTKFHHKHKPSGDIAFSAVPDWELWSKVREKE